MAGAGEQQNMNDIINHPKHYTQGPMECIDFIDLVTGRFIGSTAYYIGVILKYIWRWPLKNGIEDLEKAQWYLRRLSRSGVVLKELSSRKYAADRELVDQIVSKNAENKDDWERALTAAIFIDVENIDSQDDVRTAAEHLEELIRYEKGDRSSQSACSTDTGR